MKNTAVGAGGLFVYDNKILLVREKLSNLEMGKESGIWAIVQGHMEPGEMPLETIMRETQEEIGLKVTQFDYLLGVYVLVGMLGFVYVKHFKNEPKFLKNYSTDIADIEWFDLDDAQSLNLRPANKQIIQDFIKGNRFDSNVVISAMK